MNLGGGHDDACIDIIMAAFDAGINLFDHADIYQKGQAESAFGSILGTRPSFRSQIVLQTKCGIRFQGVPSASDPKRYDFSYNHLVSSVESSLTRLRTDYIDILLLHRPDLLAEPDTIARAFDFLHETGKVRFFGVSNHTEGQIALLRKSIRQPLIVHQLEISLLYPDLLTSGAWAYEPSNVVVTNSQVVEYCRVHDISVQAWSPLARGKLWNAQLPAHRLRLQQEVLRLAEIKRCSPESVLLAWILRHPARILPIIGSTRITRIMDCCKACDIQLSREDWYSLLSWSTGRDLP